MEEIIGMREMGAIFSVTDDYGINRESISVPLEKTDPGEVIWLPGGELEIVVPLTVDIDNWLGTLKSSLEELGFTLTDTEEE